MSYDILFTPRANKDVQKLDVVTQKRLQKKLLYFMAQPDPLHFAVVLKDVKDGAYRWRVGSYRVVFYVEKRKIMILRVQPRTEVYKNLGNL